MQLIEVMKGSGYVALHLVNSEDHTKNRHDTKNYRQPS